MVKRPFLAVPLMLLALAFAGCATDPAPPSSTYELSAQLKHKCPIAMTPVCTSKMSAEPKCTCQGREELQRLLEDQ